MCGAAGPPAQPTGFPQWHLLPPDVQRHVLQTKALSLRDLAKLAPTAMHFSTAYLNRCAAFETSAVNAATSTFRRGLLDVLLSPAPLISEGGETPKMFSLRGGLPLVHLAQGDPYPDDQAWFLPVRFLRPWASAVGKLGAGKDSKATFTFHVGE